MIKKTLTTILFVLPLIGQSGGSFLFAQRPANSSSTLNSGPTDAVVVAFEASADINNYNIPEAPLNWGLDTAWDSEDNIVRGTNHIGTDVLNIGRVSFQPSDLVDADGNLSAAQKAALQSRLNHIIMSGVRNIVLNCDHEALNSTNYKGKPEEWYKMIKATVKYCRSQGFTVLTISPFNEPDYTYWGQGTQADFKEIARLISEDEELAGIRISAGNTLNCDQALSWYNYMKPYVTEGNTHQLAGSFNSYATFWVNVRNNGHHATADELHNVGEAFIGAHYGLQSGIWWGYDGAARGQYCRASVYGKEIGYAENRTAWSAAAVYKQQDGRTDAFIGTSERQATPSSFEFLATDRPVFYDGVGPTYTHSLSVPGGTAYQTGQTNAERMVLIHSGEDVPLDNIIGGTWAIMNVNSSMCLGFYNGAVASGQNVTQGKYTSKAATHQQWIVEPVPETIGGDYGYFVLRSVRDNAQVMDVLNWSTSEGGNIIHFTTGGTGSNEQWFVEYAGNGNWYIRSRHSGLYLEIKDAKTTNNAQLVHAKFDGTANQQWRFIPINAKLEKTAPAAPQGLTAQALTASVKLSWQKNKENDMAGYLVLRALATADPADPTAWDMIGRMVTETEFIDNSATDGVAYQYKVKAVDRTRNVSASSDIVSGGYDNSGVGPVLCANYDFEYTPNDTTENVLDAIVSGGTYSDDAKKGTSALYFNADGYVQLPATIADRREMTVSMWCNVKFVSVAWQRLFDFGNGSDQYFFLTPSSGSEMRVVMKNKGAEQILSTTRAKTGWHHYTVTLSEDSVRLYVDGELVAGSADITIRPADFKPRRNYIGRSQFASDPLLRGTIDDIRIYNTALTEEEIVRVMNGETLTGIQSAVIDNGNDEGEGNGWLLNGMPATGDEPDGTIIIKNNRKTIKR